MNNEEIMKEVYAYVDSISVDRDAEDLSWYGPYCNVVMQYVNCKLSIREILAASDKLNDLLTDGLLPFSAFPLAKSERIRGQMRAMEWLPMTKGKLTLEEKERFAFCVFYYTCVLVEDPVNGGVRRPLKDFESKEKMDALFDEFKHDPVHEEQFRSEREFASSGRYGYELSNPIMTVSIPDEYDYLKHLAAKEGSIVGIDRVGSFSGSNGELCDGWNVRVKSGFFGRVKSLRLYICPYGRDNSNVAPDGFELRFSV